MQQEPYARNPLLFYPGKRLSDMDKRRMDEYDVTINDISIDQLIYSMSKQIENNFMIFYSTAESVVGEKMAKEIAFQAGKNYGGKGYEIFLQARGWGNAGSPRSMALYQDLVHSIRGPKHAAALYAEYDDKCCIVKREACIYFNEAFPQNGKYTEAFELGCFEGYKAADENLIRVEVKHCLYQGASGCEQHWIYKEGLKE